MRETLRDFMIGVSAAAALFASFQSWNTGRVLSAEITELREEVAELRGTLETTSDTVIAHVNAPGMHGPPTCLRRRRLPRGRAGRDPAPS